jgi:hypothetical protein
MSGHGTRAGQVLGLDIAQGLSGDVGFGTQKISERTILVDALQIVVLSNAE